jgi:hypothetical protein
MLDTLKFEEKDFWKIGTIGGFIKQNIGVYHPTPKEKKKIRPPGGFQLLVSYLYLLL